MQHNQEIEKTDINNREEFDTFTLEWETKMTSLRAQLAMALQSQSEE